MIAHVVLFEPKPDLNAAQRRAFLDEIRSTARNIGAVDVAYVGRPLSISQAPPQDNGQATYSFAAILTFSSQKALDTYLKHPAHDSLRTVFWKFCQGTLIADLDLREVNDQEADLLVG